MRLLGLILVCGCVMSAEDKTVTLTGWFSDEGCAKGRVASGEISPNNPECVKQCLDKGARSVFISEQGKDMLIVTGIRKRRTIWGITSKLWAFRTSRRRVSRSRR